MLVAKSAIVLIAMVPALAQDGGFDMVPDEEPVSAYAWGPAAVATANTLMPGTRWTPPDCVPGECMVNYESVEAM